MAFLIPIQYHKCKYPDDIKPTIAEATGHFDIPRVNEIADYSLMVAFSGSLCQKLTVKVMI